MRISIGELREMDKEIIDEINKINIEIDYIKTEINILKERLEHMEKTNNIWFLIIIGMVLGVITFI